MQHTRYDDGRHSVMTQGSGSDDLACGLEAQQCDRQTLTPVDLVIQEVQAAFDELRLYKSSRKQDDPCLHDETRDESPPTMFSNYARRVRKAGTAGCEGDNSYQAFRPPIGASCCVRCCGSEAEENRIARLAGDEGAVGIEKGRV